MSGRQGAVQVVGAYRVIFPAHRVVQGMDPGVAPVAIEVEFSEGGAAAGQFEQFSLACRAISVVSALASATAIEARADDCAVMGRR